MPNRLSSTAMTMTATRRRRQKSTNWSIIEQDSAPDYDLLARLDTGGNRHRGALLQQRLDGASLEGPGRGGNEHAGAVVVHEQRGARQHHAAPRLAAQRHGG